jgi:hypothetical protein
VSILKSRFPYLPRKAENDAAFESDLMEIKRIVEAGEEGSLSDACCYTGSANTLSPASTT